MNMSVQRGSPSPASPWYSGGANGDGRPGRDSLAYVRRTACPKSASTVRMLCAGGAVATSTLAARTSRCATGSSRPCSAASVLATLATASTAVVYVYSSPAFFR